jgi:hypothetical protein
MLQDTLSRYLANIRVTINGKRTGSQLGIPAGATRIETGCAGSNVPAGISL